MYPTTSILRTWRDSAIALGLFAAAIPGLANGATLRYAGRLEARSGEGFVPTTTARVLMKFTLLNGAGAVLWTSSPRGVSSAGAIGAVPVLVTQGQFEVVLGESPMEPIPDSLLPAGGFVTLRAWIAESGSPFEQLSDQAIPVTALLTASQRQAANWRLTGTFLTTQGVSRVGIGVENPGTTLDVGGETTTKVLSITGGSDIAEAFEAVAADRDLMVPGSVVVASVEFPGRVELARKRGDRRVVGVVSGANNLRTGLALRQEGTTFADGEVKVAITGRVWCWVDARQECVRIGDLLETAASPGWAVPIGPARRPNGVVGKALTGLCGDKGLVLVLVCPT